jgi:hypothetical protein
MVRGISMPATTKEQDSPSSMRRNYLKMIRTLETFQESEGVPVAKTDGRIPDDFRKVSQLARVLATDNTTTTKKELKKLSSSIPAFSTNIIRQTLVCQATNDSTKDRG